MSSDESGSRDRSGLPLEPTVLVAADSRPKAGPSGGFGAWLRRFFGRGTKTPARAPSRAPKRSVRDALPAGPDRFQLAERIGEGGMASVELLGDSALRRKAAMKILLPEMDAEVQAVQALIREAQVTGQLNHPNIVPVYDLAETDTGRPFFTMQLLEAKTLADVVLALPPAPLARNQLLDLLEIVLRVCNALAYAHKRGVIHRDVKPDNVMVGDFGSVYLVDWGLARLTGNDRTASDGGLQDELSSSFQQIWGSRVAGTPGYMPPEQAAGGQVDERSDVFAIGALLYFLVARRPPFAGSTVGEILARAERCEFTPLVEIEGLGPIPQELDRIITRALSRDAEQRHQSMLELREEIVAFMRGGSLPRVRFQAGEQIIREGDVGDHAYIIVSGRCEVLKQVDGKEERIRVIGPEECFGETAIMTAAPRTATVVTLEETVVERVTRKELLEELDALKPWVSVFLRSLAGWFRERETSTGAESPAGNASEG